MLTNIYSEMWFLIEEKKSQIQSPYRKSTKDIDER